MKSVILHAPAPASRRATPASIKDGLLRVISNIYTIRLRFQKVSHWAIVPSIANSVRDLIPEGCSHTLSGFSFVLAVVFWGGLMMWSLEYGDSLLFVGVDLELFSFFSMFRFEMVFVIPCPLLCLWMYYLVSLFSSTFLAF